MHGIRQNILGFPVGDTPQALAVPGAHIIPGTDDWGYASTTTGFVSNPNNTVRCFRFRPKFPITINRVGIKGSSVQAGSWYSNAIFSYDGNTKLTDTGPIDQNTGWTTAQAIVIKEVTLLPTELYWMCDTQSSNNGQLYLFTLSASFSEILNLGVTKIGSAANASVAGVMPDRLGVITAQSYTTAPFLPHWLQR